MKEAISEIVPFAMKAWTIFRKIRWNTKKTPQKWCSTKLKETLSNCSVPKNRSLNDFWLFWSIIPNIKSLLFKRKWPLFYSLWLKNKGGAISGLRKNGRNLIYLLEKYIIKAIWIVTIALTLESFSVVHTIWDCLPRSLMW
jgi:hypothetical protein